MGASKPFVRIFSRRERLGTVSRHVRVAGQPSLCELVQPGSVTLTAEEGNDPHSVAEDLCGCDNRLGVLSNDGFRVLSDEQSTGELSLLHGPADVGRIPRDAAVATRGRVFVTNADGQPIRKLFQL